MLLVMALGHCMLLAVHIVRDVGFSQTSSSSALASIARMPAVSGATTDAWRSRSQARGGRTTEGVGGRTRDRASEADGFDADDADDTTSGNVFGSEVIGDDLRQEVNDDDGGDNDNDAHVDTDDDTDDDEDDTTDDEPYERWLLSGDAEEVYFQPIKCMEKNALEKLSSLTEVDECPFTALFDVGIWYIHGIHGT